MSRMHNMRVDGIDAGPHTRPIEQTHVAALAQSMEALGLRTPIEVQMTNGEQAVLLTGLHRLMAARHLGWEEIEVRVLEEGELDEFDLQLWQIDENLLQRELGGPELAEHKARRRQIAEAKLSIQTLRQDWERAGEKARLTFLDWIKRQADGDGTAGGDNQPATEADTAVAVQDGYSFGPHYYRKDGRWYLGASSAVEVDDLPLPEALVAVAMANGHPLRNVVRGGNAAKKPAKRRRASRFLKT